MEKTEPTKEPLRDDLLFGAQAIAEELGVTKQIVYHYVRTKRLPIGRIGKNLIASRTKLRRAIGSLTS